MKKRYTKKYDLAILINNNLKRFTFFAELRNDHKDDFYYRIFEPTVFIQST